MTIYSRRRAARQTAIVAIIILLAQRGLAHSPCDQLGLDGPLVIGSAETELAPGLAEALASARVEVAEDGKPKDSAGCRLRFHRLSESSVPAIGIEIATLDGENVKRIGVVDSRESEITKFLLTILVESPRTFAVPCFHVERPALREGIRRNATAIGNACALADELSKHLNTRSRGGMKWVRESRSESSAEGEIDDGLFQVSSRQLGTGIALQARLDLLRPKRTVLFNRVVAFSDSHVGGDPSLQESIEELATQTLAVLNLLLTPSGAWRVPGNDSPESNLQTAQWLTSGQPRDHALASLLVGRALRSAPGDRDALLLSVDLELRKGRVDDAEGTLRKVSCSEHDRACAEAYLALGRVLGEQKRFAAMRSHSLFALRLDPTLADAAKQSLIAALMAGQHRRAIAEVERAQTSLKDDWELRYLMGLNYRGDGQKEKARTIFESELQRNPGNRHAEFELEALGDF